MPKNNNSIGIIPARYASTRFPGKPLVDIQGTSMIRRVYEQASKSKVLDAVVVATDDDRIFKHVKSFEGRVVMTSCFHKSGTDRCAEVAALTGYDGFDIVVNIQGDEPFIDPSQIDHAVQFMLDHPAFEITTLASVLRKKEELFSTNTVKVVYNRQQQALYFSRAPIPFIRDGSVNPLLRKGFFHKHTGLYAYRREVLLKIAKLPLGSMEKAESLEQLRWLEAGYSIGVAITEFESRGIDTREDLEKLV